MGDLQEDPRPPGSGKQRERVGLDCASHLVVAGWWDLSLRGDHPARVRLNHCTLLCRQKKMTPCKIRYLGRLVGAVQCLAGLLQVWQLFFKGQGSAQPRQRVPDPCFLSDLAPLAWSQPLLEGSGKLLCGGREGGRRARMTFCSACAASSPLPADSALPKPCSTTS